MESTENVREKLTIIGGGMIGAMEAYFAYQEAKYKHEKIRITVYEKNKDILETTAANIVPSLTFDEILSVLLKAQTLMDGLKRPFTEPGGLAVYDVPGINDSAVTKNFIRAAQKLNMDDRDHEIRTQILSEFGKKSMQLWQSIATEDPELRAILEASRFHSGHDAYRMDLIFDVEDAEEKAKAKIHHYQNLSYPHCRILSPCEVMEKEPAFSDFCTRYSYKNDQGIYCWKNHASAIWRPGGSIDARTFLPLFYEHLSKVMGQYRNQSNKNKNCFRLKLGRKVEGIVYDEHHEHNLIQGLRFYDRIKQDQYPYHDSHYVFCPGESVDTLTKFGFNSPACAGFAGASLRLKIQVPDAQLTQYASLNQGGYLHSGSVAVVVACQIYLKGNTIFIGIAGTKSFYSDKTPHKNENFAKNRNLAQLNIINTLLPAIISLALGRDTQNQTLTEADLQDLEDRNIAQRCVGVRAVSYDGLPILGALYNTKGKVANARCTTALGSGGVSFAPAAVAASRYSFYSPHQLNHEMNTIAQYTRSNRIAREEECSITLL